MFLPLLQMVDESTTVDPGSMGKLQFILGFIEDVGLSLNLFSVLLFMVIFFFSKAMMQYISGIYAVNVKEWFIKNLRFNNIEGLADLNYKYFLTSDVGRIQNTLTGEVNRVAGAYFNYFKAIEFGVLVMVYTLFAFRVDAQFALLVTTGGILSNLLFKQLYKNTKNISRTLTGENNVFQGLIIQNVLNYKYLKATGSLKKYAVKLRESVFRIQESNRKIGRLDALLMSLKEPILVGIVVGVILIQITVFGSAMGPILLSLVFFYRALSYLLRTQTRWNKFLALSGSLENMVSFEKELKKNVEINGTAVINGPVEEMELKNADFYYGSNRILKNINLSIKRKETIAFVGESGSGKTTLINIIAGLLPLKEGTYEINGINSKKINMKTFQNRVGYITQDPVIFNDTLYNNISFWSENSKVNREKFWKVMRQASLLDFVNELPQKENTVLGSNGMNLSGGQRQRVSIARELFKETEILMLDEATSALDSETEKAIQQNIENLQGQYTILIVAHQISTIKNADRIVVMKNGDILKSGDFRTLLNESKYFKSLVEFQELKVG